jgi:Domain of unknown function (DUF4397)
MRLLRHIARLAAIAVVLAGPAALVLAASPAASAATSAAPRGWVRIAHLSPKAPAMDMYLYPFGDPGRPTILRDVSYGDVSAYMTVSPGQYTLAMRGFGAAASSAPALVTTFVVSAGTAYTAAALGPDPGLRVEVLKDQMAASTGRALVRVLQASLKDPRVSVRYGPDVLARQLPFGSVTSYAAVSPGAQTVRFTAPGGQAAAAVRLAADTTSTIVVLDDPTGLKVDALSDAAGSQVMPAGGVDAGRGGTALVPPADRTGWLLVTAAGTLLALAGLAGLRRPAGGPAARRGAPAGETGGLRLR